MPGLAAAGRRGRRPGVLSAVRGVCGDGFDGRPDPPILALKVEQGLTFAKHDLFHLGDRVFYPWGASAVRIRFIEDGVDTRMTVNDPDVVLTAWRRK